MKNVWWVGLLVLGLSCAVARGEDAKPKDTPSPPGEPAPKVLTLREAVVSGVLKARGFDPGSYRSVSLQMTNVSQEALHVDVCASHLVPRGHCQRLGLGPVAPGKKKRGRRSRRRPARAGTVVIELAPGAEKTVRLQTCCLDAGKPAPRNQRFRVARTELPKVREAALRWWADHPDAPQGQVNQAIWQNTSIESAGASAVFRSTNRAVAAHGGSTYMLRGGGDLALVDPDGVAYFLGTGIEAVFPAAAAVYAVSRDAQDRAALWRLVLTGDERWKRIASVPADHQVLDVRVAPTGEIFVITSKGFFGVRLEQAALFEILATENPQHLSLMFGKRRKAHLTRLRPPFAGYQQGGERKGQSTELCELYTLDVAEGTVALERAFWNVGRLRAGPLGVFALTPAGKLRRLVGRSLTPPGRVGYDRILSVGRKVVWLQDKFGRAVAVDKSGRRRFQEGPTIAAWDHWAMDGATDALLFVRGNGFFRIDPASGVVAQVNAGE